MKKVVCFALIFYFYIQSIQAGQPSLHSFSYTYASATSPSKTKSQVKSDKKRNKPEAKRRVTRFYVTVQEVEAKGIYDVISLYIGEMCIKEVPFFLSLHRSFYRDPRIANGDTLVLRKSVLQSLQNHAIEIRHLDELRESSIKNIDSMYLFKEKKNRKNKSLCNLTIFLDSGPYEIPKTGAKVRVPNKITGSVFYNNKTGTMMVYVHTMGIKLELPGYAKALTLGLIGDMDIGFAGIERTATGWKALLLYSKEKNDAKKTGWSFNVSECNKIRPCTEE
jgi:hypothetical protein